jgi:predicted dehydrogenase
MAFQGIEDLPELNVIYDVEEHSSVFVRFQEGPVALFETAWATNYDNTQEAIIMGTKGGLKLDPFTYYTKQDQNQVAIKTDLRIRWGMNMRLLIEDFTRACLEDKTPKTPGEDGLKVMQVINGAYESSKLGREVQVSEL